MIDEALLTRGLDEAARTYEPPEDAVAAILTAQAATEPAEPKQRHTMRWLAVAAGLVVAAVTITTLTTRHGRQSHLTSFNSPGAGAGTVSGGGGGFAATPGTPDTGQVPGATPQPSPAAPPVSGPAGGSGGTGGGTGGSGSSGGGKLPITDDPGLTGGVSGPAADSATRIVKRGQIEVEVHKGRLQAALAQLTSLVTRAGGYIASSKVTTTPDAPSGVVILRVPVAEFERVLAAAQKLDNGTVRVSSSSGQDVTAQFVDLGARVKSLTAARERYLTLLGRANTIGEVLSVQERIDGLQGEIDQLSGQRNLLANRAALGTLTVSVGEPGAADVTPPTPPKERTGFAKAWHDAVRRFTSGLESFVAGLGTVALLVLFALVLLFGGRVGYRIYRRRTV